MDHSIFNKYEPVIGLEVHCQLLTKSKIYTSDSTTFGDDPNTNVSVISLGHPGTLPKLNIKVIEYAIRMGLACNSEISRENIFDRKNYFYPDLPKGYQLTQDRTPICKKGFVTVNLKDGKTRNITLNRIHVEEDAGKSIHLPNELDTLIDLNRAGVPLIELVTEPDIHSADEAAEFLTEVRRLVRYLGICDGNMEQGSLRCDANISVRPKGQKELGKKVEVKNMNSIRNMHRAVEYEIERQIQELEKGNAIFSETRTYNEASGTTSGMRTKEELNDYRYFPDPDLSPFIVTDNWLNEIETDMPSLPWELKAKLQNEYNLPAYDAEVLTDSREFAEYFLALCEHTSNAKAASNWLMGPVKSYLNENTIDIQDFPLPSSVLAKILVMVDKNEISFSIASQRLFPALVDNPNEEPLDLAKKLNLLQDTDESEIEKMADDVLAAFPDKVKAYRNGKKGLIGMFMGELMKKSKGKADPKVANELLRKKLS